MTTTRVEGHKIFISLELSVERDGKTGGYFVAEQDGPHVIKWGPMPYSLVSAFCVERGKVLEAIVSGHLEKIHDL